MTWQIPWLPLAIAVVIAPVVAVAATVALRLIDLVAQVDDIVGAAITEHAPAGDDVDAGEAEVIRQLGAALVDALKAGRPRRSGSR